MRSAFRGAEGGIRYEVEVEEEANRQACHLIVIASRRGQVGRSSSSDTAVIYLDQQALDDGYMHVLSIRSIGK